MGASGKAVTPHSLARQILQRTAKAEDTSPLRVIGVLKEARVDLRCVKLAEAAEHLVVVDVHEYEDLHDVHVVMIPGGQKGHPLFETAEVRRRERMLG